MYTNCAHKTIKYSQKENEVCLEIHYEGELSTELASSLFKTCQQCQLSIEDYITKAKRLLFSWCVTRVSVVQSEQ